MINLPLLCSRQAIDSTIVNNEFTGWFGDMFDQLNIVSTFNLAYNAGLMVKENVGYALTLDSIINTSEKSDLCFIPFEPELIAKHNIVWRKDHSFSKAAQVFLDKAKELETTF
ncbi:LysR family transcriptional regulator [Mammaliicoccus lentus]|uniref:LysR family transcriptional regulator n=1 Tax=Mammaliicoccus lentus TaxID=42858 RepID=A0AAX3W4H7_MAMLE|nr:LysR family transcriptional regulator [Mammaliicoccus lentus]WHI59865.1 LysR family transcriptional regulator [Mammaliicoccus lentus]